MQFTNEDATVLPALAKAKLASRGDPFEFRRLAQKAGTPERLQWIAKAAVGAVEAVDLGDYFEANRAFVDTLRSRSIFYRLLADGARRVPFNIAINTITASATAALVGEGAAIPTTTVSLADNRLQPQTVVALLIVTLELSRSEDGAAQVFITDELRAAVTAEVDRSFIGQLTDTGTVILPSGGNAASDALADLRGLLEIVNTSGGESSALFWLASVSTANRASTLGTSGGALVFPEMTPTGGAMLGIPALVSNQVPAGELLLVRAHDLAMEAGLVELDSAGHANIEMSDDPTDDASAVVTSMWQSNQTAIRAVIHFGAEKLKADSVAILSGIAWGSDGGSPA